MKKERLIFTQKEEDRYWHAALLFVAILLLMGVMGAIEDEDKKVADDQYCYQIARNKADPTQGWPDYEGKYKSMCSGAGLKSGL